MVCKFLLIGETICEKETIGVDLANKNVIAKQGTYIFRDIRRTKEQQFEEKSVYTTRIRRTELDDGQMI